ncbi:gustatory receptor for sugar taste 43a-like [Daktulosphaira vitifoliae]|uniref:gustatory receptor for sugar taste 43a-like n=1 Tax=Daktulosphaira vitifoliae TaxID=58002 RepID=UPI0021AAA2D7|nr:gustatory receptor for sugar taste 43a-like [Daktulosphaira vitifoliae]XP_050520747.1 gustatory receptor for sugar taste 43a-like [Daktulosphaira vitifoliae]
MVTRQAYMTKIFVTDISNRYLDKSTKEELQLFLIQISRTSMDFSACDFCIINAHLITSAIAVVTTYLVIFLQFYASAQV